MNPFAISGLLIVISSSLFGIFVFVKNRKSRVNQSWAIFSVAIAIWGYGFYKGGNATIPSLALFWYRIAYIGIIFIPVFFYHFVCVWLGLKKKTLLYLSYLYGFFFLILEWSPWKDLFFGITNIKRLFTFYWVYPPTFLLTFFVIIWFAIVFYAHYKLYQAFKKSSGLRHNQIKYFFLATAIGFSGGGTCFLPCFGINLYPIFNFTVPLYPVIMTYAILKYRLMDIRVIIGRGAIYLLSLASAAMIGLLIVFLNNALPIPISLNIIVPFMTCLGFLLFRPLFGFYEKVAGKYFYYTFYSLQQTIRQLGKKLNQTIELDKLTTLINRSLLDTLKLDKVGIILRDPETGIFKPQQLIKLKEEEITSLLSLKDNFLQKYLQKEKKALVREEIPFLIEEKEKRKEITEKEKEKLTSLKEEMEKRDIALFLPLFIKEELIGIIILGNKLSGEAYTVQDLDLLTTLASQAAIAFNNALSYTEIEKRKEELEKFYKLTVGRELRMIELKKKIKELEEKMEKK